jgi:hypothetical protein
LWREVQGRIFVTCQKVGSLSAFNIGNATTMGALDMVYAVLKTIGAGVVYELSLAVRRDPNYNDMVFWNEALAGFNLVMNRFLDGLIVQQSPHGFTTSWSIPEGGRPLPDREVPIDATYDESGDLSPRLPIDQVVANTATLAGEDVPGEVVEVKPSRKESFDDWMKRSAALVELMHHGGR